MFSIIAVCLMGNGSEIVRLIFKIADRWQLLATTVILAITSVKITVKTALLEVIDDFELGC